MKHVTDMSPLDIGVLERLLFLDYWLNIAERSNQMWHKNFVERWKI